MPYPERTRKFLETRALSPGEVRVRIMKGEDLLYSKIGHKGPRGVFVEYMGVRHLCERFGQTWRLDVEKIARDDEP